MDSDRLFTSPPAFDRYPTLAPNTFIPPPPSTVISSTTRAEMKPRTIRVKFGEVAVFQPSEKKKKKRNGRKNRGRGRIRRGNQLRKKKKKTKKNALFKVKGKSTKRRLPPLPFGGTSARFGFTKAQMENLQRRGSKAPISKPKSSRQKNQEEVLFNKYRTYQKRHSIGSRGNVFTCEFCQKICHDVYSKEFACGHRLCHECLERFVKNSQINGAPYFYCVACQGNDKAPKVSVNDASNELAKYPKERDIGERRLSFFKFTQCVLPRYSILRTSPNYKKKKLLFCQVRSGKGTRFIEFKNRYIFKKKRRRMVGRLNTANF